MRASPINEITLPDLNGGINTHDPEYGINDNQSPDMLNLWFRDKVLSKRDGQELVTQGLDGDVYAISGKYNGYQAVHAGEKLYRWDGKNVIEKRGGIEERKGVFIEFGDTLFYIDGTEIWKIAADYTISEVTPYSPVVMINTAPDMSESDDNESYNLIGGGFTVHYNGDDSSTTYSLPQTELDADTVLVSVDAADLTEGTDFTVNRTDGTVNFSGGTSPHGAPGAGTNNVWVTAFKANSAAKAKITSCTVGLPFGGESSGVDGGTRVFVMGNSDFPYTYWRSDLGANQSYGMAYFPDTSEELLDQNSESITAAAKMNGELIIFKKNSIFAVGYVFDGQDVFYPVRECNSAIGCDMPGSVQLVDNQLVFANSKSGVHMLISTSNELENTVKPLSANINSLLLSESSLEQACSCDYARYYWLCAGGYVYLWDYEQTPYYNYSDYEKAQKRLAWYRFSGINANVFYSGESLHYGCAEGIVKFIQNKNDFGEAYNAYFVSKAFDLGKPQVLKTFMEVYPSFSSDGNVKVTVSVGNEKTDEFMSKNIDIKSFDWGEFNWEAFTWNIIKYAKTFAMKLKMRMVSFIQIKVTGSEANRGVGLTGIRISYFINRKVKR